MIFRIVDGMAGTLDRHATMLTQPRPAFGRQNFSSPPKGRDFQVHSSEGNAFRVQLTLLVDLGSSGAADGEQLHFVVVIVCYRRERQIRILSTLRILPDTRTHSAGYPYQP